MIQNTRRNLAEVDKKLLGLFYQLSSKLYRSDWDKIDAISFRSMENELQRSTERQKSKFQRLTKNSRSSQTLDTQRTVINVSNRNLSQEEVSVLAKGGNFAITPKEIPKEEIIANLESALRFLPEEKAQELRTETARILKKAKPPKSNLKPREFKAIRELNKDENILVLPADKGNATVVINTEDYKRKINDLLDPGSYKELRSDPTQRIVRTTKTLIYKSDLGEEIKKKICKNEATVPRLYGLPKIHKANIPLRPIVSAVGSPTYDLAKYLSSLLQPHIGQTDSYIKDSTHFISKIKDLVLEEDDLLLSFDVVSLFTKVPVKDTMERISEIFSEDISNLFKHCLTTTYFSWDNKIYEQIEGVAMGSPLSPVIANFFMEKFEQQALESAPYKPKIWFRYVDDTFVIWNHGQEKLQEFLEHINGIHENIQFTMEMEENHKLAFLDVLLTRKGTWLGHTVYRKPTHTDRYLHRASNHHPAQKYGIIKTLSERATRICEPEELNTELTHLYAAFRANGYSEQEIRRSIKSKDPRHVDDKQSQTLATAYLPFISGVTDRIGRILRKEKVKTVFKPTRKIQECLRSAKDKKDPLSASGVYRIPCTCGSVYIGTTKRFINTRIKEHKANCRLGQTDKSAVAEHTLRTDHRIKFEETQVLATTSAYYSRLYREAIEIEKHTNNFNKKEEAMKINKTWIPIIRNANIAPFTKKSDDNRSQSELPTKAPPTRATHKYELRPRRAQ